MNYSASTNDIKKWENHFLEMAEGKVLPNKNGVFIVKLKVSKKSMREKEGSVTEKDSNVRLVTPTAQVLEIAKSDIKNAPSSDIVSEPVTHFEENITERKSKEASVKRRIKESTLLKNKESKRRKIEYWTRF